MNTHPQPVSPQLAIEFSFQTHQLRANNTLSMGEGLIQFSLQVGSTTYGPYLTSLRTTQTAWFTRKALLPPADAKQLDSQVQKLNKNLWDAWKTFPNKQSEITGEMILARAGMKVFSVATGGALYVI